MRKPKVTRKKFSQCPVVDCRAANPPQSPADDKLARSNVTGTWVSGAMRCGYCDTVYSIGPAPGQKTVRGYFDIQDVWHPAKEVF
jgi:hypothetical protein